MRLHLRLLALVLPVVLLAAACGDDDSPPPANGVSDETYLKVVCTGTRDFSDALISQSTAEGIAKVIKDFVASMKAVEPPADLSGFHKDIVKYLETAVEDPTSLATKKRPQPPEDVRKRLAAKESGVPECQKGAYFTLN